jgi:4-amino-4-deoxy-L-arabinose transferase-like glycosyltransferase
MAQAWLESYLLPACATLLALGLSLHKLESKSLWFDELATLTGAGWQGSWLDAIRLPLTIPTTPKPPLSYLVSHAFMLLGDSVFLLRLPAALFAILTVPLVFALGQTFFDRRTAWLAAFLLAIAPLHVRYGQEMRMYAMLTFLSLLSLYLFWRAIGSRDWRWWLGFAVVSILALYTHLFALLPLGVMVLFVLWLLVRPQPERFPFRARHFTLAVVGILAAYLPLVPFLTQGLLSPEGLGGEASPRWDLVTLASALRLFSGGADLGPILYLGLLVLALLMLATRRHKGLGLLIGLVTLPAAVILLAPFGHGLRVRYFLFSLPVYLLLVACGLRYAIQWLAVLAGRLAHSQELQSKLEPLLIFLLLVMFVGFSYPSLGDYYAEAKQNWRDATWLALSLAQPGDQILVRHLYHQIGVRYYASQWAGAAGLESTPDVQIIPRDWENTFLSSQGGSYWLIVPLSETFLPGGRFEAGISPGYRLQPPYEFHPSPVPKEAAIIAPVSYGALAVVPVVRTEPAFIDFWADELRLTAGGCTLLHWEVRNIREVYLEQQGVVGAGEHQVCPTATTVYHLEVVHGDGTRSVKTVEISVTSP